MIARGQSSCAPSLLAVKTTQRQAFLSPKKKSFIVLAMPARVAAAGRQSVAGAVAGGIHRYWQIC